MKRFGFILLFAIYTLGGKANQMNVLFIMVDDLNCRVNSYGQSQMITPHIDALAAQGVMFQNAYCQWSVCGPSRASLLTGQLPDKTGVRNLSTLMRDVNPDIETIPRFFKKQGYETAACGKIFDPRCVDSGHDTPSWTQPYNKSYQYPSEYGSFVKGQYRVKDNQSVEMGPEGVDDDGYMDGQICLEALGKLEGFKQSGKPFFLAVGFKKPHVPFIAPKKYWDLYHRDSLKLESFQQMALGSPAYAYFKPEPAQYDDIPDLFSYDDIELGNDILEPHLQQKLLHGYYACVSYVDAQIGKLVQKLKDLDLSENTMVVMVSDHGYHLGDHNQWGKHTNFENAVRAPLVIYHPKKGNNIEKSPVEFTDIFPTITTLVFNQHPAYLPGIDLSPSLSKEKLTRDYAVSEYRSSGHAGYSIRTNRYRMSVWMKTSNNRPDVEKWDVANIKDVELYDFEVDSLNTTNYYSNSVYSNTSDSLLNILGKWWDNQHRHINGLTDEARVIKASDFKHSYDKKNKQIILPAKIAPYLASIYDMSGRRVMHPRKVYDRVDLSCLKQGYYVMNLADKYQKHHQFKFQKF